MRIDWNASMPGRYEAASCAQSAEATAPPAAARIEGGYVALYRDDVLLRRIWIGYSPLPLRAASSKTHVYVLTAPAADGPARLLGFDARTGFRTMNYPVPYSGSSLDVASGIAIFSTTGGGGLYGLRLSDGQIAFLAAERADTNAQIEAPGIAYVDNLYPSRIRPGTAHVKFVPLSAVRHDLARVGHTLRVPNRVRAFAMDGPRVSLVVAGPEKSCDRILHWNIPWHYTAFISKPGERAPTCATGRTSDARATSLALGGLGSAWVLHGPNGSRLVRENSVACVERVLATGRIPLVAADRSLIAFVRRTGTRWTIGTAGWRTARPIATSRFRLRALSVDGDRIAALRGDGKVEIWSRWGSLLTTIATPGATSIALNTGKVTVVGRSRTLDVFDADTGRLEHSWRLPEGAAGPVDVQYGVAVVTRGTTVLGIRLATGRTAALTHAPARVRAQIEGPGVAYQYNVGGHGFVGFVSLARIEQLLGTL